MMHSLINFSNNESGAVTVDWILLTAAIVTIALAVISVISGGLEDASENIVDEIETVGTG
ncbi:hypothetical protein A9Q96_02005 [Rhodobacterales bacterium 52_120_T64]|nr:hypothetical protein A9Q96_02005 [Rhodobacterales bacterium 52_120_T64]